MSANDATTETKKGREMSDHSVIQVLEGCARFIRERHAGCGDFSGACRTFAARWSGCPGVPVLPSDVCFMPVEAGC